MATIVRTRRSQHDLGTAALRLVLVSLALATAAIHASLGGLLFTANAIGYAAFAGAMVLPGPIGQVRWLVRLGLLGFTAATMGGWVLFGARFPLAYLDKAIEAGLIGVVGLELWRLDGGLVGIVREARRLVARLTGDGLVA